MSVQIVRNVARGVLAASLLVFFRATDWRPTSARPYTINPVDDKGFEYDLGLWIGRECKEACVADEACLSFPVLVRDVSICSKPCSDDGDCRTGTFCNCHPKPGCSFKLGSHWYPPPNVCVPGVRRRRRGQSMLSEQPNGASNDRCAAQIPG